MDFIQRIEKTGKLILVTSSLTVGKKVFGPQSLILGFFAEFKLEIIKLSDVLRTIRINDPVRELELAILMREPITIPFITNDSIESYARSIQFSFKTIPALLGEVFTEENRKLTTIYEGIVRAIASRKRISSEISSYLFSLNLISKDNPSLVQPYLNNLQEIGIVKRIKDIKKNRYYYFHSSPLLQLFFYGDEKYSISNRDIEVKELNRIINEELPRLIESNIREAMARKLGLDEAIYQSSNIEIDGLLIKFKKVEVIIEVKWFDKLEFNDLLKAKRIFETYDSTRDILITKSLPDFDTSNFDFEIWDASKLITELVEQP